MRLKRFGTKKRPFYRVVVMDNRRAATSITIDEVGTYQPVAPENQITLDAEKIQSWYVPTSSIVMDVLALLLSITTTL